METVSYTFAPIGKPEPGQRCARCGQLAETLVGLPFILGDIKPNRADFPLCEWHLGKFIEFLAT